MTSSRTFIARNKLEINRADYVRVFKIKLKLTLTCMYVRMYIQYTYKARNEAANRNAIDIATAI